MFIFTKEMAKKLKEIRERSRLTQQEVAKELGLKAKYGQSFIARLENGLIKNPSLKTILDFLRACGASWTEFFKELDTIDFKMRHENLSACGHLSAVACLRAEMHRQAQVDAQAEMIAQVHPALPEFCHGERKGGVHPPPTQRKIQRDAMRYEIGIEFPSKEKEEIDFERLKRLIKDKVTALVNKEDFTLTPTLSHQGRGGNAVIADYQKFALEYFDFLGTLNKAGMKMVTEKWRRAGLKLNLLFKIKKIINSVLRGEIKRITTKKPLPTCLCRWHGRQAEKQEKMAIGLTKYRIRIERMEAAAHRLLCESGVPTPLFSLYKDFVRECYRTLKPVRNKLVAENRSDSQVNQQCDRISNGLKKYYGKNQELLDKTLNDFVQRWQKEGLKEEVLLKVKDKTVSIFATMRLKQMV
jgi:transcriptional regulator with XRE-family HTH domain